MIIGHLLFSMIDYKNPAGQFLPLVDRTSQPEEMMLHSRDRSDVTALAAHKQMYRGELYSEF